LLSASRLRDAVTLLRSTTMQLGDPVHQQLLADLERRLLQGGQELDASFSGRRIVNRSIIDPALVRSDSLQTLRFPLVCIRLSKPLPDDDRWRHPDGPHVLEPGDGSHPYPIEIDLPPWTLAGDIDLRRWLFGFGNGVIIDVAEVLRRDHRGRAEEVVALDASAP
jgi:hypothetical protein